MLTQVALNVLNLNCLSRPLPLFQRFQRPESTREVAWAARSEAFSPLEGEMSFASTMLRFEAQKLRDNIAVGGLVARRERYWTLDCRRRDMAMMSCLCSLGCCFCDVPWRRAACYAIALYEVHLHVRFGPSPIPTDIP